MIVQEHLLDAIYTVKKFLVEALSSLSYIKKNDEGK